MSIGLIQTPLRIWLKSNLPLTLNQYYTQVARDYQASQISKSEIKMLYAEIKRYDHITISIRLSLG